MRRQLTSEDVVDSGELELWMMHEVHPEEGCPALNARLNQWADDCDTFQAGWLDWYENNQPIC